MHVTVARRYQWNSIPNEHWNHTDDELIDCILVKKRGDDLTATHQPDILARLLSKTAYKGGDWFVRELHTWRRVCRRRLTGEDDASIPPVEPGPHSQAHLVGLAAQ